MKRRASYARRAAPCFQNISKVKIYRQDNILGYNDFIINLICHLGTFVSSRQHLPKIHQPNINIVKDLVLISLLQFKKGQISIPQKADFV
jgi:hypothetical protein